MSAALTRFDAGRAALLLVALAAALPFLLPEHRAPLPSFHDEFLALTLLCAALTLAGLARADRHAELPELSVWLVLLAAWIGVAALTRAPAFWQLPGAAIVYLVAAAAAAWLGRALAMRFGLTALADAIAIALLAGAVANALIGLMQLYGIPDALRGVVATSSGPRIVGHVGQGNLYLSYLALGAVSLAYLCARGLAGLALALACGAVLVLGLGHAQSRALLVYAFGAALLGWLASRRGGERGGRFANALWLLFGIGAALLLAVPLLRGAMGLETMWQVMTRLTDAGATGGDPRPALWWLALGVFLDAPLLGAGWGEFAGAAFAAGLPRVLAEPNLVWTSAHNVLLQVLAECGVVGAAIVIAAALRWWLGGAHALHEASTPERLWALAIVGVICLHALVEYPLWYAHVLVLFAFVAGAADTRTMALGTRTLRFAALGIGLALGGLLVWTLDEHRRLEGSHATASGRTLAAPPEVSAARAQLRALAHGPLGAKTAPLLHAALAFDTGDDAERLALGERLMRHRPAPEAIARHAAERALAGDAAGARALLERALATYPTGADRFCAVLAPLEAAQPAVVAPLLDTLERAGERCPNR